MTLYEMLDKSVYWQQVWIYSNNNYDQNMPVFKGLVCEARRDDDMTWDFLENKIVVYEFKCGILVIKVESEHPDKYVEDVYCNTGIWGKEKEKRPWRYSIEIDQELKESE